LDRGLNAKKMKKIKLVLGSASPRRRELLSIHFKPKIKSPNINEAVGRGETPMAYVKRMARLKWQALASGLKPGEILLTADTVVIQNKKIFGKARSPTEAARMLRKMSGRAHSVSTAVCVGGLKSRCSLRVVTTRIKFRALSALEIAHYIRSNEWRGKAGAYGIQGLAAGFVDTMNGSLTNVIGLPLEESLKLIGAAVSSSSRRH